MKISKSKVKSILNGLGAISERPTDKKGNLDLDAFNKLPEVKRAVAKLKELGVDKKWLFNNFQVAGMLLRI